MKIQLLLTGNELMAGHTVDSNSAMIAEQLASIGFSIERKVTLGDDFNALVSEMKAQAAASDVLIVNGGLGPTVDDLTAEVLACVAAVDLEEHPRARAHIIDWCKRRRIEVAEANLKQALLPAGATMIDNPSGSAPGFYLDYHHCLIICTPGVPSELRGMMQESILDILRRRFPSHEPTTTWRFQTFGLGESTLQDLFRRECSDWPSEVELGFRAGLPQLELKLSIKNPLALPALQTCRDKLYQLIGDYIVGTDNTNLAEAVLELLACQGKQITTAESCTGGLIASNLTAVPGASSSYEAGFVTYSNAMKTTLLGVDPQLLEQQGAVSEAVVRAMLQGAMNRSGADCGIAVSGIAGPEGGTEEKPVGTVWIAWGDSEDIHARCLQFPGSRHWFQSMVTAAGLDLIRRHLAGIAEEPRYLGQRRPR